MQITNIIAVENKGIQIDSIINKNEIFTFKNVSFSYPGKNKSVLNNLNFSIDSGKFYVLVGENGIGKTTLVRLICRLFDTSSGDILYNGINLKQLQYKEYRNLIGIVFQDYNYYDLSIAENVAMNEYLETDEIRTKIYDSLAKAGLKDKIDSLPYGIDTQLGRTFDENGVLLSGGEVQKMALSRILFKDAPIVILDEPSSALDAFAEDELIKTFNEALKGKTVFYISHRLSVAKYADKVIFLSKDGMEFLSHNEMLLKNKKYAQMYDAQAKHYREG